MELDRKVKQRSVFILILLISIIFVTACSPAISEEERDAVYNLIEWNLYYARVEDLTGYMWALHPEAPGYNETQAQMAILFGEFDLTYNIEEWEILSVNDQSARVRVVQTTRLITGTKQFRDNRVEAVHTLRKDSEGEWKLYTTEIDESSLEYLE